jgi:hypothetical protein
LVYMSILSSIAGTKMYTFVFRSAIIRGTSVSGETWR